MVLLLLMMAAALCAAGRRIHTTLDDSDNTIKIQTRT
jgi:hypothetical protein